MLEKLRILDLMTLPDEPYYEFWEGHMDYNKFEISRAGTEPENNICEYVKEADILLSDPYHRTHVTTKIIEAAEKLSRARPF